MASRAEWGGDSLCCEGTAPDPGDLVSEQRGESSLEGTGVRVEGTGVGSLDGSQQLLRFAPQFLDTASCLLGAERL